MQANSPTYSPWRLKARSVIVSTVELACKEGLDRERDAGAIRDLVAAAYPFGERKYMPYKIWLQEVRLQCEFLGVPKARRGSR